MYWKRKFEVPYILDFHDPWVRICGADEVRRSWKESLLNRLAILMERSAVLNAAGLVAVSPNYISTLQRRYEMSNPGWLAPNRHAVIPFGALGADLLEAGRTARIREKSATDELIVNYVGAGGPIMLRSFSLICRSLAYLRTQGGPLVKRVRIRLYGTVYDWQFGERKHLEDAAQDAGVGELVSEHPGRVSYRRSLELLLESDGALILGVDEPGYMPSKLFGYALSGKPLLASLRRDGPAFAQFQGNHGLGHAIWIDHDGEMPLIEAAKAVDTFLQEIADRRIFDRRTDLEPYLATAMARRHANLFDTCLKTQRS